MVSIHAPGRGATISIGRRILRRGGFNSRTREGCDTFYPSYKSFGNKFQFTHPGGVRLDDSRGSALRAYSFNSRTREGCDRKVVEFAKTNLQFQFTHPGGVRRDLRREDTGEIGFNSRTREGCDFSSIASKGLIFLFQFTHPGGVRPSLIITQLRDRHVSIHAPGRGATSKAGGDN